MNIAVDYFPALRWHRCTAWYEGICSLSGLGNGFKNRIIETALLRGDELIADIGCGDGTFLGLLCRRYPHITAYGLDPDAALLSRTEQKVSIAKKKIVLEQGYAQTLPWRDAMFDVVFCTLTLHHLADVDKKKALREIYRVLRPGGRAVIVDFGNGTWASGLHVFENQSYIQSCFGGKIPSFLQEAGLTPILSMPYKYKSIAMLVGLKR